MKASLFLLALLVSASPAYAARFTCEATQVMGGPLDESFSVEEYPDVYIDAREVSIGSSNYSMSSGDTITITENRSRVVVDVVVEDESEAFEIVIDKRTKKGTITYKTPDTLEDMAELRCK